MIDFKNISGRIRRQHPTSLLGLALEGRRLDGVWLKRTNGSLHVQASLSVTLTLDPITNAPELVGREIRNQLDAAEIRERRCVVALPHQWVLSVPATLPALPESDLASFLQLEAERGFPCDLATLVTATSRSQSPAGSSHALVMGIARQQVSALEAALRAARLQPESFTLALTALQSPAAADALALVIGDNDVGLQLAVGGGVLSLRSLAGAVANEGGRRTLLPGVVAREVRITLGQWPDSVRTALKRIRVFGPRELALPLGDELELQLESLGLEVEVVSAYAMNELGATLPVNTPVSAACSVAAHALAGRAPHLEFLPPRQSQWQQLTARYGTGKLRHAGLAAGAVLLLVIAGFSWQQAQLWRLQMRWAAMSAQVGALDRMQANIVQYRPWFDESLRSLSILRELTMSFPQDGSVTAKSVEFRGGNVVTCTGTTRDNAALLRALAALRQSGQVAEVKLNRLAGAAPMQFTFDFRWVGGGGGDHGN